MIEVSMPKPRQANGDDCHPPGYSRNKFRNRVQFIP